MDQPAVDQAVSAKSVVAESSGFPGADVAASGGDGAPTLGGYLMEQVPDVVVVA